MYTYMSFLAKDILKNVKDFFIIYNLSIMIATQWSMHSHIGSNNATKIN